jgi:membrane associated rhomboid family serine protease
MLLTPRPVSVVRALRTQAIVLGASVAALWIAFAVDELLGGSLLRYGVHPRSVDGLGGILFAPFLHANFDHIAANTIPVLALGWLVMLRDPRHFFVVVLAATLGGGLTAWLLGSPNSVHIGASGVVFGFFGFLVFAGWYARSLASILLSVLVVSVWGGLVFSVLPGQPGISWQEHLGGFVGGALAARWYARSLPSVRLSRQVPRV